MSKDKLLEQKLKLKDQPEYTQLFINIKSQIEHFAQLKGYEVKDVYTAIGQDAFKDIGSVPTREHTNSNHSTEQNDTDNKSFSEPYDTVSSKDKIMLETMYKNFKESKSSSEEIIKFFTNECFKRASIYENIEALKILESNFSEENQSIPALIKFIQEKEFPKNKSDYLLKVLLNSHVKAHESQANFTDTLQKELFSIFLQYAVLDNDQNAVDSILQHTADPELINDIGSSAIGYAVASNNFSLVNVLKAHINPKELDDYYIISDIKDAVIAGVNPDTVIECLGDVYTNIDSILESI